jgi:hypothetical protein
MPGPDSLSLAASAAAEGLDSLLVGGNAINLLGYSRTTFDVDLLVRDKDMKRWVSFFARHGYAVFHRSTNFIRLRFNADPAAALPVDLMLADKETFEKILAASQLHDLGNNVKLAIPSPLHLIAMKLHALRNPARLESGIDLQDVKHLIRTGRIDTSSKEFTEITSRYATPAIRDRLLRELGG